MISNYFFMLGLKIVSNRLYLASTTILYLLFIGKKVMDEIAWDILIYINNLKFRVSEILFEGNLP